MSFFHPSGMFATIQICLRLCRMLRMLKAVYLSALMAYASISSGPSAFLLLIAVIGLRLLVAVDRLVVRVEVFLVLVYLIVLQSVYHLSNCSSVIVRRSSTLSFTALFFFLLELVRELHGNQIHFSQVSLPRCFLYSFGQVVKWQCNPVLSFLNKCFLNFSVCGCVVLLAFPPLFPQTYKSKSFQQNYSVSIWTMTCPPGEFSFRLFSAVFWCFCINM